MSTYRERRMAKAERLREWAAKREANAEAVFKAGEPMRRDWAFITQPGHIPERARIIAREDRALQSLSKAGSMRSRADNIEAAAEHAIYSDDEDAVERLQERIAELEAQRDRIKAYNASARKAAKSGGVGDLSLLDEKQRRSLLRTAESTPYMLRPGNGMPAYVSSNLSGNIGRLRKRLAGLQRDG